MQEFIACDACVKYVYNHSGPKMEMLRTSAIIAVVMQIFLCRLIADIPGSDN